MKRHVLLSLFPIVTAWQGHAGEYSYAGDIYSNDAAFANENMSNENPAQFKLDCQFSSTIEELTSNQLLRDKNMDFSIYSIYQSGKKLIYKTIIHSENEAEQDPQWLPPKDTTRGTLVGYLICPHLPHQAQADLPMSGPRKTNKPKTIYHPCHNDWASPACRNYDGRDLIIVWEW